MKNFPECEYCKFAEENEGVCDFCEDADQFEAFGDEDKEAWVRVFWSDSKIKKRAA